MSHPARTRPRRPRYVTLLATAGILVSLVVALVIGQTAVRVVRMSAWPTVPATLDQVELHLAPGTTRAAQSVAARYHYTVGGVDYTGTQVSVYAPDSLGNFFPRIAHDLRQHLDRHEPVPVHVNPAAPTDAVLLPVWRPELMLLEAVLIVAFGGVGWALLSDRIGPWRAGRPGADDGASAQTSHGAVVAGRDPVDEDRGARLPPAAAWARRWALLAVVLFAADFVLLDYSRGDSYFFVDRLLASQMVASGTIGAAEAPAGAVEAAFERARRASDADARLSLESRRPQDSRYTLTVAADTRDQALAGVDVLLANVIREYRSQSGRDLDTFRDPYVVPLRTPELLHRRLLLVGGLFAAGLACCAVWWRLSRTVQPE